MTNGRSEEAEVEVITVAYNGGDRLLRAVKSSLDSEGVRVRAVVVDNASIDDASSRVARLGASVVRLPQNVGYGAAFNEGLRQATAKWVVCANQDVEVSPTALHRLLRAARDHEAESGQPCLAAPRLLTREGETAETWHRLPTPTQQVLSFVLGEHLVRFRNVGAVSSGVQDCELVSAVFVLGRTATFRWLGGFDPRYFMYVEDVDLFDRLRQQGGACVWVPDATVTHFGARAPLPAALYAHALWNWKSYFARAQGDLVGNVVLASAILGSLERATLWWVKGLREGPVSAAYARMFLGAAILNAKAMVRGQPPPRPS